MFPPSLSLFLLISYIHFENFPFKVKLKQPFTSKKITNRTYNFHTFFKLEYHKVKFTD